MEIINNAAQAASAEEATASATEIATPTESVQVEDKVQEQGEHTSEKSEFGVDSPNANELTPLNDTQDKSAMKKEFERLIKGDYKEFYEERVRENLSRRFKENAETKRQNEENRQIVDLLCQRYNVASGDINSLKMALDSDNAYLVAEADKRGMSIEDFKYMRKLEMENRSFAEREARLNARNRANATIEKWFDESRTLKESYPEFDIFAEAKNESFVSLLQKGIDVKTAYEVVHHAEIMEEAEKRAAREAEIKTAEAIRQKSMRPAENGISSKSSAIFANGVSSLTPGEREEIARRVARGERISF